MEVITDYRLKPSRSERSTIIKPILPSIFLAGTATLCQAWPGHTAVHHAPRHAGRGVAEAAAGAFSSDLQFLRRHTRVMVLRSRSGHGEVIVSPQMQGRVFTSTAAGPGGASYGWINRKLISSGKIEPHINVYGGEDRFWIGPEGGQFSVFFKKGSPFDLKHWQTPAAVDTEPFTVVSHQRDRVQLRKNIHLVNYSGTHFNIEVNREVRLLNPGSAWRRLGVAAAPGVKMVAYETDNSITNRGKRSWKKATGLPSIWILGMFNPSPTTTIVVPYRAGPEAKLGPVVNDVYFEKVPPTRLVIRTGVMFFSADGTYRSKIGVPPRRVKPLLGSYDSAGHVLTLVQFTYKPGNRDYVNSLWKLQKNPYGGDVANSYNDGPPAPGAKPLGPFYELESSSPAAALKPGETMRHVHRTMHIQGPESELDRVSRATLGVGLSEITHGLPEGQ